MKKGKNKLVSSCLIGSLMLTSFPGMILANTNESMADQVYSISNEAKQETKYKITVDASSGGLVQVLPTSAEEGETVRITLKPNYGYQLDTIKAMKSAKVAVELKQENTNVYSFTMPDKDVAITVTFEKKKATTPTTPSYPSYTPNLDYPNYVPSYPNQGDLPFTDVVWTASYYDAVKYCFDNNLMNGYTTNIFAPNDVVTRAMVCAVLCNLEGGAGRGTQVFADVPQGQWYSDSVNWAARCGIVNGYGNGFFGPEDQVTREQLVSILHKYAVYKGYETHRRADLSAYRDVYSVSGWAYQTMSWAVGSDVLTDISYHYLNPQGNATRGELASTLMNFDLAIVR